MFDNFLVVGLCTQLPSDYLPHLLTFYLPLISILHPNYSKETKEIANFGAYCRSRVSTSALFSKLADCPNSLMVVFQSLDSFD